MLNLIRAEGNLRRTEGIDFVLTTHEGGAAFMAAVCGQLTGVPGVCFGTYGPGATNLATGVGCALLDRLPMIALSDEMPDGLRGRTVQMGIDHQALFRPLTKHTTRLANGAVRETLESAAAIATTPRPGPVHVGLPVGLSAEPNRVDDAPVPPAPPRPPEPPGDEAVARARALLAASRRPVLALGLGAVHAGLGEAARAFAERLGVPVVLTPMAKGLVPESHRCYAGVVFHALSDVVGETHARADAVLAVGYDPVEFGFEGWLPDAPLVNVDVAPADIPGGHGREVIDVTGDVAAGARALFEALHEPADWDLDALARRRAAMFERLRGHDDPFGPCASLRVLREVLPEDGIMTCDVGAHTHLIGQQWPTPAPGLQLMTNGWSAMGYGVPAAIAAAICRPGRAVCCVAGDGGFLMSAGELATAVRLALPVVFVVLTDNDLALIRIKQQRRQNPIYGTPVRARGSIGGDDLFGVPVLRAADPGALRAALERAFAAGGPVIVEARISSAEYDELVLRPDRG